MRNDLKLPETSWNHLKPAETTQKLSRATWNQSYCSIFYLKQIILALVLLYYSTLKCFLGKYGPKNWGPPNWLKFGTEVHCYIVIITILTGFFQNFCRSYFFGQIWLQILKLSKLTEIFYCGKLLYA